MQHGSQQHHGQQQRRQHSCKATQGRLQLAAWCDTRCPGAASTTSACCDDTQTPDRGKSLQKGRRCWSCLVQHYAQVVSASASRPTGELQLCSPCLSLYDFSMQPLLRSRSCQLQYTRLHTHLHVPWGVPVIVAHTGAPCSWLIFLAFSKPCCHPLATLLVACKQRGVEQATCPVAGWAAPTGRTIHKLMIHLQHERFVLLAPPAHTTAATDARPLALLPSCTTPVLQLGRTVEVMNLR